MTLKAMQNILRKVCFALKNFAIFIFRHIHSLRFGMDPIMTKENYVMFEENLKTSNLNNRYLAGTILHGISIVDFYFCLLCQKFLKDYEIIKWWNGEEAVFRATTRAWIGITKHQRELIKFIYQYFGLISCFFEIV